MNRMILVGLVALLVTSQVFAQAQPEQQGPRPKSRKESEALMAVQNATDADARIKAAQKVLMEFKKTEFKEWLLYMIVAVCQRESRLRRDGGLRGQAARSES